jgi:hypothetical protein
LVKVAVRTTLPLVPTFGSRAGKLPLSVGKQNIILYIQPPWHYAMAVVVYFLRNVIGGIGCFLLQTNKTKGRKTLIITIKISIFARFQTELIIKNHDYTR